MSDICCDLCDFFWSFKSLKTKWTSLLICCLSHAIKREFIGAIFKWTQTTDEINALWGWVLRAKQLFVTISCYITGNQQNLNRLMVALVTSRKANNETTNGLCSCLALIPRSYFHFLVLLCPLSEDCHIIPQFSFRSRHVRVEGGRWTRLNLKRINRKLREVTLMERLLGATKFRAQVNWKDFFLLIVWLSLLMKHAESSISKSCCSSSLPSLTDSCGSRLLIRRCASLCRRSNQLLGKQQGSKEWHRNH